MVRIIFSEPQFPLSESTSGDNIPQISRGGSMVTVLRPLSTSELLDRTFHLYRNNFLVFVGITALPQIAVLALQLASAGMLFSGSAAGFGLGTVIAGLASFIAVEISHAATIMAVSNLHLDRPASIGYSYSLAKSSIGRVIGISLGIGVGVGIGLVLLVVPGVYLALAWSLAIPVTVLEGGGLNVSTTRSKMLSKGSRGRIFVIYLLLIILIWIVQMCILFVLGLLLGVLGVRGTVPIQAAGQAITAIGSFIGTSLVGPLVTIALTLIYYDQRVRKEGFDLQLMMATLQPGQQSAATTA
jgi:hypothetical protein